LTAIAGGGGAVTVSVSVSPPVHANQQVRLLVGPREVPPDSFPTDPAVALDFTASNFASAAQWVRLRVDEAESLLVDRSVTPPRFDPTQLVVIP
jgi:hypothetical protein